MHHSIKVHIVAYRPVAGHGPRSEQRDNDCCLVTAGKHNNNIRAVARQLLGKRVPAATVEVLSDYITMETVPSMWFVSKCYKQGKSVPE
jgi:hypothetical protein